MKLKMVESSEKERKTVPSTLDAELTMEFCITFQYFLQYEHGIRK